MKTYWENQKFIIEYEGKREIRDYTYRLTDFFKPTLAEIILGFCEVPLSCFAGIAGALISKGDIGVTIACGASPQVLTYLGFRAMELGIKGKHAKELIRKSKKILPYGPKVKIEHLENIVKKDSNSSS